jgi:hypothetical protein
MYTEARKSPISTTTEVGLLKLNGLVIYSSSLSVMAQAYNPSYLRGRD